jgi:hypothetical protein
MKYLFLIILSGFIFYSCFAKQGKENSNHPNTQSNINANHKMGGNKMKITIGKSTFIAILYDNKTAEALKALLPLSLNMRELNANEKYAQLSTDLPTNATSIGTIQEGDLLLWGSNTLVVFYKTFPTSYQYTKIGRIENPEGLAAAVGSGNVTINFSLSH